MTRYPRKGELQHLKQAYVLGNNNWAEERFTHSDRSTSTVYECLTCHDTVGSTRRFNETVLERNERIREWKRNHKTHPKPLIEVFAPPDPDAAST